MKCAKVRTKEIFYKNSSCTLKVNPLGVVNSEAKRLLTTQQVEKCLYQCQPNPDEKDPLPDSESHDCEDDELENDNFISNIPNSISNNFMEFIQNFRRHSTTIAGGCRSNAFLRMETCNLVILCNNLGESNIFNPTKVNLYISNELSSGKSPSTIQSRLYSIKRFLDYMKSHFPSNLPDDTVIDNLTYLIKGAGTSLSKRKKKRQQRIISDTRRKFPNTIHALNQWREKRNFDSTLNLFPKYSDDITAELFEADYSMMRDFLIVELLIPNGQRPGVIHGVIVDEIKEAITSVTKEGYHKLIVSNHKTGYVHGATMFIYSQIFSCLTIFIENILPKLPIYATNVSRLTGNSSVFQTFSGQTLLSCRVTPILRTYLSRMGIQFSGTVTDLRKAAATLTGKYSPNLHELMALFLCHSVRAHDKYYRIQVEHDGLTEAFNSLERFHTLRTSEDDLTLSNRDHLQHLEDDEISSSKSPLPNTNINIVPEISSTPDAVTDILPFTEDIGHCLEQEDYMDETQCDASIPVSICSDETMMETYHEDTNLSHMGIQSHENSITTTFVGISPRISQTFQLKTFEIRLNKVSADVGGIHPSSLNNVVSTSHRQHKPRYVIDQGNEDEIFHQVFPELTAPGNRSHITNKAIIERSYNSENFAPILHRLYEKFPEKDAEAKIIHKFRKLSKANKSNIKSTYGQFADTLKSLHKEKLNLSADADQYLRKKTFNKSIFLSLEDEMIFRNVYSHIINRVAERKFVSKHDIIKLIHDTSFTPVYSRLQNMYAEKATMVLIAKVRSVGNSKRLK